MKKPLPFDASQKLHPALDFKNNYYVGFPLETMATVTGEYGKTREVKRKVVFIRCEQGLIAMDELGEDFKYDNLGEMPVRISQDLLHDSKWIEHIELMKERLKYFNVGYTTPLRTAYEYIKKLYQEYVDFSEEETHDFKAVWDIGTYFHPLFHSYPYLHIHGLANTGKTHVLKIGSLICFNAIESGSMTESPLFRMIERWRPTFLIDETDALANRKNNPEFTELLLNGYKKFGKAWRSEKLTPESTFTPTSFDIYSPKMLANIEGLEDVLATRTIKITMWRSKSDKFSKELFDNVEWQDARDLCYLALFNHWREIKDKYDSLHIEGLLNRDKELWKPILSIAKCIGEDAYGSVLKFAQRRIKEMEESMNVEKDEYKLAKSLFRIAYGDDWYNLADIKKIFMNEYEDGAGNWITSQWISKALDRLGFKRIRMYMGRKQYYLGRSFIDEILQRFNISVEEIKPLDDKKVPRLPEQIYEFIKRNQKVGVGQIVHTFTMMGATETDIEKAMEKLKREGQVMEPNVGVLAII